MGSKAKKDAIPSILDKKHAISSIVNSQTYNSIDFK